ncbi:MAG: pyridoxamine 5'-phosphate oxidase [Chromatiales bacterium]|nr:pyridoxamine 5'-phosphate oxidase [Chromatiales bacterium]
MADLSADLADLRRDYRSQPLRRADLDADPFRMFDRWFRQALEVEALDANAMSVATCSPEGQPSSRMVLLKGYDPSGFVFYTNLQSRKAREIDARPRVALLLFWPELRRQVRIEGEATRLATAEALRYFLRRPRDSQLGAWASPQSNAISGRQALEMQFARMREKFAAGEIPLPDFWGGYRVLPALFEFWQGRENRLHDRFTYRLGAEGAWDVSRLAP